MKIPSNLTEWDALISSKINEESRSTLWHPYIF